MTVPYINTLRCLPLITGYPWTVIIWMIRCKIYTVLTHITCITNPINFCHRRWRELMRQDNMSSALILVVMDRAMVIKVANFYP